MIREKQIEIEKQEKKKELLEKQQQEKKKDSQNNTQQSMLKSPEKLLSKPKTHYEATEEQKKLMNILKQNFNTAKSHLLTQKYLVEEAQTSTLSAQKQRNLQKISQSQILNPNSKCIEFGASIIKTEADEPEYDESKKRIQNQNELYNSGQKQQEVQQTPKQEQQIEEASNNSDNRIIFLTPQIKQTNLKTIPSQKQINVMSPKIALLYATSEKANKQNQPDISNLSLNSQNKSQVKSYKQSQNKNTNNNNSSSNNNQLSKSGVKSHIQPSNDKSNKQALTDRVSTQATKKEEFTEIKASQQFKQYFKPVIWNQEILNQETQPIEFQNQINQYNNQPSNQAIRGTQTRFVNGSNDQLGQFSLNQLKQTYSPQQQSLQQIGKSLQFISQNLANNSQEQTLNQIYTFNQLQSANHDQSLDQNQNQMTSTLLGVPVASQSLLYSKALSKQLEESITYNNQPNAKHVYVDFNGQNIHDLPKEEKDPYKRKLLQQQMNTKQLTQKEIEDQLLKLQQWKSKKDQKIQLQREVKQEKVNRECTFKPDITPLSIKDKNSLMLTTSGEKQVISSLSPQKKINSYVEARKQQQEYLKTLKKQNLNTSQNLNQMNTIQNHQE